MLCYRRFFSLRSAVFLALLCTFLLTIIKTNDVFALDDVVFNYNSTNASTPQTLCFDTGTDGKLCGYEYVIVSSNFSSSGSGLICRAVIYGSNVSFSTYFGTNYSPYSVFNLSDYPHLTSFRCWSSASLTGDQTFSLTFTNINPFGSIPSGSLSITENGTYDVTSYASAVVDVPPIPGDYHDDLVNIRTSIYTCGAILLVLYFFYCIYRMIIRGVKK